jgi:restriction endonuclease S subunit
LEGREISENHYSELREYIFGSDFNSKRKTAALFKITSKNKVIDYFDLHSDIVSNSVNVMSYDLTHTLGNFIHEIGISKNIEGTRKLANAGDFIISRLRSYLKEFAVVQENTDKQVFSTEYLVYRPNTKYISANTLLAFCLTKEVQTILNCSQYGTEHPRFYEFVFNELPLPDFLFEINDRINNLFLKAHAKRKYSQSLYKEAEELLIETLGLKDFQPSNEGNNIKTLKESFLKTGRLDAEYYQIKYEEKLQIIKKYANGYGTLQQKCNLKDNNFTPKDEHEYKYIELADIGKSGNVTGCTIEIGQHLPSRARRKVNVGDVIVSSIEGSLGSCALITQEYNNAICSTGFYVINSEEINSETLLVLFKSKLMQELLKQNCSGTILTAINKTEFQNLLIPIIDICVQTEIADLIKQSFALRKESENLLQEAKEMVEKEIENRII